MKKKIKPMPKFRNEQDEREFWSTHDTTDYFDFSKTVSKLNLTVAPSLRGTVQPTESMRRRHSSKLSRKGVSDGCLSSNRGKQDLQKLP